MTTYLNRIIPYLAVVFLVLSLSSCVQGLGEAHSASPAMATVVRTETIAGFRTFELPKSSYDIGQIYLIRSGENRVEILHAIPLAKERFVEGKAGESLTASDIRSLTSGIQAKLSERVGGSLALDGKISYKLELTNVRVREVSQAGFAVDLESALRKEPGISDKVREQIALGHTIEVCTAVLVADVVVRIDEVATAKASLDLKRLIQSLGGSTNADETRNNVLVGKDLKIGFQSNPSILTKAFERIAEKPALPIDDAAEKRAQTAPPEATSNPKLPSARYTFEKVVLSGEAFIDPLTSVVVGIEISGAGLWGNITFPDSSTARVIGSESGMSWSYQWKGRKFVVAASAVEGKTKLKIVIQEVQ